MDAYKLHQLIELLEWYADNNGLQPMDNQANSTLIHSIALVRACALTDLEDA